MNVTGSLIRATDVTLAALGLIATAPILAILLVVGWIDTRAPIFRQERVGLNRKVFVLYKFRTMNPGTESVATHLAAPEAVTRFGRFLRATKLDELPQLWNVLKGDMSLVGPRPCLLNQTELIEERAKRGVFAVRPGITGLAQIRGIDMSTPELLAETDRAMIDRLSWRSYFCYIVQTALGRGQGDRVRVRDTKGGEQNRSVGD